MYRVMYWIGTGQRRCDLRLVGLDGALELQSDYVARGYSACIVDGKFACRDAEAGFAVAHKESAHF